MRFSYMGLLCWCLVGFLSVLVMDFCGMSRTLLLVIDMCGTFSYPRVCPM